MIKRKILQTIRNHLTSDQMTVLVGSRQVGKTYLMDLLRTELQSQGLKTVFLNLDIEEDRKKLSSQTNLLGYIDLVAGKEKAYVFIDEIQRKENAGLFLKGIFDLKTKHKFIISGSGSLDIRAKISESLAGRKQIFEIDPISFEEFANFKTNYEFESKLVDFYKIEAVKTEQLLLEYMSFGGYPRIVLAADLASKLAQIEELFTSFVDKDIVGLLRIEKSDILTHLLKILASQIGSPVNVAEISSTLGIDVKTVKKYLYYLEETFIVSKVTPYFRNPRTEISKAPIYYFVDLGLRNFLLGIFGLSEIPTVLSGHLFENFFFNMNRREILSKGGGIHYWRTRDQAEVDFVIENGLTVVPVEVKFSDIKELKAPRSMKSFIAKYTPKEAYLVHKGNLSMDRKIGETDFKLRSYYQFLKF